MSKKEQNQNKQDKMVYTILYANRLMKKRNTKRTSTLWLKAFCWMTTICV